MRKGFIKALIIKALSPFLVEGKLHGPYTLHSTRQSYRKTTTTDRFSKFVTHSFAKELIEELFIEWCLYDICSICENIIYLYIMYMKNCICENMYSWPRP